MRIITVENDGIPWVVCAPADSGEVQRFLDASAASAVGSGFDTRPATPKEASRWSAEHALHVFNGGESDAFFATSL